ncbi:L-2-hydroxyglutarate dehydrogenase, mitochondrial isoform X1 [Selaginella moellendorffii]|nr:L-2-hydroxyglutarate dehydrogenase, mitochondrial isoform X1 [Selaginella moellendorffii]|eukprot:XP_002967916.2 L-2-hydroxyglutarate dehydrogenase, mitochondrial isoform X1 [Selaginella moellendorffii]
MAAARILPRSARNRFNPRQPRWMSALSGKESDVAIVGGGIVGLATAREIVSRFPWASVTVVEKEKDLVPHQTSHNSGVIHAGIYYEPGSAMAKLCVDGARRMYEYCESNKLPYERVGKLIVATAEEELPILKNLYERATANKVQGIELLDGHQVQELEPNVRCLQALHSPNTGIVDYAAVGRSYARDFLHSGRGEIHTNFEVKKIDADENRGVELTSQRNETVKAKWLITCAGLHSDYVARLAGGAKGPTVLPFRGNYHELKPEYRKLVKRNIYPVPDPKFPMVGVHLTPRVDGRVLIGPNSALALSKEGYAFWNLNIKDALTFAATKGLWKLVLGNPKIVFQEIWRDVNIKAFVGEAQRYCPSLKVEHTTKGWAGVHAVAIDDTGKIISDFLFESGKAGRVLNVRNAPSPACTSSLAIATTVVDRAAREFDWKNEADILEREPGSASSAGG